MNKMHSCLIQVMLIMVLMLLSSLAMASGNDIVDRHIVENAPVFGVRVFESDAGEHEGLGVKVVRTYNKAIEQSIKKQAVPASFRVFLYRPEGVSKDSPLSSVVLSVEDMARNNFIRQAIYEVCQSKGLNSAHSVQTNPMVMNTGISATLIMFHCASFSGS